MGVVWTPPSEATTTCTIRSGWRGDPTPVTNLRAARDYDERRSVGGAGGGGAAGRTVGHVDVRRGHDDGDPVEILRERDARGEAGTAQSGEKGMRRARHPSGLEGWRGRRRTWVSCSARIGSAATRRARAVRSSRSIPARPPHGPPTTPAPRRASPLRRPSSDRRRSRGPGGCGAGRSRAASTPPSPAL